VAAVGGRIHVIGGGLSPWCQLDRVDIFDPASGTWTPGAPLPSARNNLASAVLGGRIYVVGGLYTPPERRGEEKPQTDPSPCVDVYDPATDSWSQAPALPSGRVKPAVVAVDGCLYVLGGRDLDPGENTSSILAYRPGEAGWTEVGQMPVGFRHSSGCSLNGKVYVTGGWTPEQVPGCEKKGKVYSTLVEFDPKTGTCRQLAELPVPRVGHVCVACDGRIWVFGGIKQDRSVVGAVHAYDPKTDRWSEVAEMASTRAICEGDVLDGTVYLPCGWASLSRVPNPDFVAFHTNA
jgi:N-acetylneuraminic acid mutarotase